MPQEFHVVQCTQCQTYQVDIIKKAPKWTCKMCGFKQPLSTVHLVAPSKDCRERVQELNAERALQ